VGVCVCVCVCVCLLVVGGVHRCRIVPPPCFDCRSAALPMQMQELIVSIRSGATLRFANTCLSSGHMAATIMLLLLLLVVGCCVFGVLV
jgi:hypothetical protein